MNHESVSQVKPHELSVNVTKASLFNLSMIIDFFINIIIHSVVQNKWGVVFIIVILYKQHKQFHCAHHFVVIVQRH